MPCGHGDSLRPLGPPGRRRVTFRAGVGRDPGQRCRQGEQRAGNEAWARGSCGPREAEPTSGVGGAGDRAGSSGSGLGRRGGVWGDAGAASRARPAWEPLTVQGRRRDPGCPPNPGSVVCAGGRQAEAPAPVSLSGGRGGAADPGGVRCVLSEPGRPSCRHLGPGRGVGPCRPPPRLAVPGGFNSLPPPHGPVSGLLS